MALQHSFTKDGITYDSAYTRVEGKVYKGEWVTQERVAPVYETVVVTEAQDAVYETVVIQEAVEAQEAVLDADGNVVTPAVEAKEAVTEQREVTPAVEQVTEEREVTPEVPEVKEWKSILRVYSYTYSSADNSKGVKAIEEKRQGECVYNGGDVATECYAYLKTLEEFKESIDA